MAIKPLKRKYHMSDGQLLDLSAQITVAGDRDLADLATFGVTQTTLDNIESKTTAFVNHPLDEYYAGLLMEAVADREAKLAAMHEVAKGIVQRGHTVWGEDFTNTKKFGYDGFAKKSPAEKVMAAKTTHKVGTDYLAELAAAGLTQLILDDLATKVTAAGGSIIAKTSRVSERDEGTKQRIVLGNALYDALVSLASIGKNKWENVDESKYNDYVIYISPQPVQVATGTVGPQMVIEPSVVVDSPNDTVKVKNNGTKPLDVYCGDDPTDLPQAPSAAVAPGTEVILQAEDIGWTSTMNRLLLYNADATDSVAYEVRVS